VLYKVRINEIPTGKQMSRADNVGAEPAEQDDEVLDNDDYQSQRTIFVGERRGGPGVR
jgi:hypothetical protein